MTDALILTAAAKVNLTLHITGRRQDGFHILDSLIGFTGVTDTLSFVPADDITLSVSGPEAAGVETDARNLVVRAAKLTQSHTGTMLGAAISLEKNIPVAAGLGGGSADAAAAIAGCLGLWGLEDTPAISNDIIAAELGADVPVCRFGKPARVGGIGESITVLLGWPHAWLVLVNPRIPLSTADVFKAYDGSFRTPDQGSVSGGGFADFIAFLSARGNDLTDAACLAAPVVTEVLQELTALPECALARMSGSGPTCFGLFETKSAASSAAHLMTQNRPDWWSQASPLLTS